MTIETSYFSMDVEEEPHSVGAHAVRQRALSSRQERRLVNYLDDRFLQCVRNYQKRNEESSLLRSLPQYLEEVRHILALILQIPPIDPSTGLRTYYLLRLTGDIFCYIPGYKLEQATPPGFEFNAARDTLQDLVDFLDDLDQAWLAVLEGQAWDTESAEGISIESSLSNITLDGDSGEAEAPVAATKTTLPNQTDTTRLRSLLVGGESALEEWLLDQRPCGEANLADTLQHMGLLEDFDNLFVRTLSHLGEFQGEGMEEGANMELGDEVPMSEPFGYKLPDPDPED